MITIDELKVQLAEYGKSVQDLEEALAIDASKKQCAGAGAHHDPAPAFTTTPRPARKCLTKWAI